MTSYKSSNMPPVNKSVFENLKMATFFIHKHAEKCFIIII